MITSYGVDALPGLGAVLETLVAIGGCLSEMAALSMTFKEWSDCRCMATDALQHLQEASARIEPLQEKSDALLRAIALRLNRSRAIGVEPYRTKGTMGGKPVVFRPNVQFSCSELLRHLEEVAAVVRNTSAVCDILSEQMALLLSDLHAVSEHSGTPSVASALGDETRDSRRAVIHGALPQKADIRHEIEGAVPLVAMWREYTRIYELRLGTTLKHVTQLREQFDAV